MTSNISTNTVLQNHHENSLCSLGNFIHQHLQACLVAMGLGPIPMYCKGNEQIPQTVPKDWSKPQAHPTENKDEHGRL